MKKVFYAIIGSLLFCVSGIAQTGLANTRWQVTELNGKKVTNSRLYLEFDEGQNRLSGHAGCNRFFGAYELDNDRFKVNGVGSTKMACMRPGLMETEAAFLKALGGATELKRNGQNLRLYTGKRRVLSFKAAAVKTEPGSVDLTSRKWLLKSINEKAVSLGTEVPFLNFDSGKKSAGGNSGCNVFGGNYEADGSRIKFSDIISTMRACEFEDRMSIERGFLEGLQNADRFEIKNGRLFIYKGGDLLLEFEGTAK
jgi:heat shock protein HslJ